MGAVGKLNGWNTSSVPAYTGRWDKLNDTNTSHAQLLRSILLDFIESGDSCWVKHFPPSKSRGRLPSREMNTYRNELNHIAHLDGSRAFVRSVKNDLYLIRADVYFAIKAGENNV